MLEVDVCAVDSVLIVLCDRMWSMVFRSNMNKDFILFECVREMEQKKNDSFRTV